MKTGMKIFIGLAAIAAIMGGFLLKKSSDKKKVAKSKQIADDAAADAAAKKADTEQKRIAAIQAKAAADKAKADLVRANTVANQAAAAAAAQAAASAQAAHDKAVADQAAADAAAAQAQAVVDAQIVADKLRANQIFQGFKSNQTFANISDAEFFINNKNLVDGIIPTINDVKLVLRKSNMVYFNNVVTVRLSREEANNIVRSKYQSTFFDGKLFVKAINSIPTITTQKPFAYLESDMQKLVANGWWFGITIQDKTSLSMGNIAKLVSVYAYDKLNGEPITNASSLVIIDQPRRLLYLNTIDQTYFSGFSGKAYSNISNEFSNKPNDLYI